MQMEYDKPFNYHFGLRLLLSQIILSQTWSRLGNESTEHSEVDNRLEINISMKISCRCLSFPPISSQMEWQRIKTAWLPSTVLKWQPLKSLPSRQISSEAETSVKGKTWMFTCYRWRQKSKLFGVPFFKLKKIPWLLMLSFIFHYSRKEICGKNFLCNWTAEIFQNIHAQVEQEWMKW